MLMMNSLMEIMQEKIEMMLQRIGMMMKTMIEDDTPMDYIELIEG
jgi:hypothetical protein